MKGKMKFDSAQLKQFLLHHVEKIVFGGFVVAFLLICWSAFKLKPYDKTPDQLQKQANDVAQQIEQESPPAKFEDLPIVPSFSTLGAVGPAPVDPRFYAVKALSLPYEERVELRKQPKFFALDDLLAFPGKGGIAIGEKGTVNRVADFGGGANVDPSSMNQGSVNDNMYDPSAMQNMMASRMGAQQQQQMQQQMQQMQQSQNIQGKMQSMMGGGPGGMPGAGGAGGAGGRRGRRTARSRERTPPPEPIAAPAPRPKPQSTERIAITQAPPDSQVEGRYWTCLVGVIPYWKQLNEYQNAFRDSRFYDVRSDYPLYATPEIERAEVNGSQVGEWQKLDVEEAVDDMLRWAAEYPETEKTFHDPFLTEPLPPLVFANHDKEKVTHPRLKVADKKPQRQTSEDEGKKKTVRRGLTGIARNRGNSMYPGNDGYGASAYAGRAGNASSTVEQRLFRFFDFAVEPGKTYRYRVKLVLVNPNASVPPRYLENYEYHEGATREAEWSQSSPDVTVIAGNRLLAGVVNPGSARSEPSGKVLAKLFDADLATEIRREFDISRGSVLNELQATVGLPERGGTKVAKTLDFETDAVVLDMFGGDKIPGAKSKSTRDEPARIPGHILVLDTDGELKTLVQSKDAGMYETEAEEAKSQAPPADEKDKPAQGGTSGDFGGFLDFNSLDTGKKPKRGK